MPYFGNEPAKSAIKVGDNTVLSATIANGVIINEDIKSDAAIAMSKTALVAGTGITLATNTLNVDAAQTQITSVGTIGTGVWQGTVVASAYLDADTAHLSTTQTFSGDKTFSGETTFSGFINDSKIYNHLKFVNSDGTTVNGGIRGASNSVEIRTGASTTVACTFDGSQNATFAGDVTIGNDLKSSGTGRFIIEPTSGTSDFEALRIKNDTHQAYISLYRGGTERGRISTNASSLYLQARNNGSAYFVDDSGNGLSIADGGNATC